MPIFIHPNCINCDMCVPECPHDAIHMGPKHYQVDATLCTQCEGFYDKPTCIEVCPIGAVDVAKAEDDF